MDDQGSITGRGTDFSLRHRVQTSSGDHRASYPMGKAAEAWSWPLTSI